MAISKDFHFFIAVHLVIEMNSNVHTLTDKESVDILQILTFTVFLPELTRSTDTSLAAIFIAVALLSSSSTFNSADTSASVSCSL